jgi:hypothetical protein
MKLAIIVSRSFDNYDIFIECIRSVGEFEQGDEIITVPSKNDIVIRFADKNDIPIKIMSIQELIDSCDYMIAFPTKYGAKTQKIIRKSVTRAPVHIFELKCNGYNKTKTEVIQRIQKI